MLVIWLTVVLVLYDSTGALKDPTLPDALFYPFGVDVGDTMQSPGTCGLSDEVPTLVNFPFFSASYRSLFVNSIGVISFLQRWNSYTTQPFPIVTRMITPFWSNIHTENNDGRLYYRQTRDAILLNRVTQDVRKAFWSKGFCFFKAKWIFIGTWHNVTYNGGNRATPINSFQVVLITDEKHSFAMFNYGGLGWSKEGNYMYSGLTDAVAGYNAGDNVNFYAIPGSMQPTILQVAQTTNVGLKGRWMFRVDSAAIEAGSTCETEPGKCAVHQLFDVKTDSCLDVAPAFDMPRLDGPVVINRRWVEFYCAVPMKKSNHSALLQAAFNVTFLFDGEPAATVPSIVVKYPDTKATLHEKHLSPKLIGKWISCRVFSFWLNAEDTARSQTRESTNSYWAGIEVSSHMLSVREGDPKPAVLTLKSTIPITCKRREGAIADSCDLTLKLTTPSDIRVRSRNGRECEMTLSAEDWKHDERKAYRPGERIEIFAHVDSFMTSPRWNTMTIEVDKLPKVTVDGKNYMSSMWSRHKLPEIGVYHHDEPHGVCTSTGDPHVRTFDRHFYTIYATGQFTYVQTTRGRPVEVQLRHKPCGQTVSCVCGVAARENDVILVADMCGEDSRLHFITYNDKLREGADIKRDDNGRVFEINLPSKIKVIGYANSWAMSVQIYVTSSERQRTEGLCGSLDSDPNNDLMAKGRKLVSKSVSDVVESWRVPLGKSLFDGIVTDLPVGSDDALQYDSSLCTCLEGISSCERPMADESFQNGPNVGAKNNVIPKTVVRRFASNSFARGRRALSESDSMKTDDIDWEYDSSAFNFTRPEPSQSPQNASGMTEEDARRHCQRVLWDDKSPIRAACQSHVSMSDVNGTIDKCVLDIQMTGDLSWADDKIPEIQNLCIFEAMTANITESNSTIEDIVSIVQQITAVVCLPQDCSGHGTCRNGTCICDKGYIGSDCALSEDAVPNIIRALGPSSCDLDRYPCQKVEMITKDVKSLPKLVCKVEVTKSDNSKESFDTVASVETMDTSSCKLPTDELQGKLRLIRTNSIPTTSPPEVEPVDFYSLPHGNPVLHYSISISNNGRLFSNSHTLTVYDSRCYTCPGLLCFKKENTCLINGYCFTNDQRNPFNPERDWCDPSVSTSSWTKATDLTVTLVAIVTVVAVILTVIVVFFVIRRK
jgi:hypothetical protein